MVSYRLHSRHLTYHCMIPHFLIKHVLMDTGGVCNEFDVESHALWLITSYNSRYCIYGLRPFFQAKAGEMFIVPPTFRRKCKWHRQTHAHCCTRPVRTRTCNIFARASYQKIKIKGHKITSNKLLIRKQRCPI